MLAIRIIPVLLLKNERMVKTIRFNRERGVGESVKSALVYNDQDADELVFLDITAMAEERTIPADLVRRVSENCFMPLTFGGGIRTISQIRELLNAGADKVVINSIAIENPEFVREAAEKFGNQCIVVSVDTRKVKNGRYEVFACRGKKNTGIEVVTWAKKATELGAGEIFLTSIDNEGTMQGYDIGLIEKVASAVDIPVIAHGGAGTLLHLYEAVTEGRASAVACASLFLFTSQNIFDAKTFLRKRDINARPIACKGGVQRCRY